MMSFVGRNIQFSLNEAPGSRSIAASVLNGRSLGNHPRGSVSPPAGLPGVPQSKECESFQAGDGGLASDTVARFSQQLCRAPSSLIASLLLRSEIFLYQDHSTLSQAEVI